jgi:hypothetical protein
MLEWQSNIRRAFFEAYKHHWENCLQSQHNRSIALSLNADLAELKNFTSSQHLAIEIKKINHKFDKFNSQFGQLVYKLIVSFCQGTSEKFSSEIQNLRNFNWDQMGAALITWQQFNILQNPLVNHGVKYNYEISPGKILAPGPIKKPAPSELNKLRVEFEKNLKSRKADEDMSMRSLINLRIQKVLNTFQANKDNLFINCQKRYFDIHRDNLSEARAKYERSHDILLSAVRGIRVNWLKFVENQSAKKFSPNQLQVIDDLFWGKKTPNLISTSIICNNDLDHAVGLFNNFLGMSESLNWPHRQLMHLPPRDIYVTLNTRGILSEYIRRSLDWAACNSVILTNGGITELPLTAIHQLANENWPEEDGEKGDLQFVEDLLINRNISSAHLVNNSNGILINSELFKRKKQTFSPNNIPNCISKN